MKNLTFPFVVKSLAVLSGLLTLVFSLLYHAYRWPWCLTTAISTGVTAYHFGMRLLVGWLVPSLTDYQLDYAHPWFRLRAWEPKLYQRLNLRKLKKHLPTYDPSQYDLSKSSLAQIIRNTCGSEIVHETIMALSFLPLALVPWFGEFGVFLMTSIAAALVDSLFVMAQRYNRPRLVRIYEKQEAKTQ